MKKSRVNQEKGISMISLVITIIILVIVTNVLIYTAQDSIYIKKLTQMYNDIELLREKTSEYYNEYGKIPAQLKYTNIAELENAQILSEKNDTGDFYVLDLAAMQGITLNYGKDYEKIKNETSESNVDDYKDIYIINEKSHNIFYVKGIEIKEKNQVKIYHTTYTETDETTVDLRYIDGIIIPEGYYYIGKTSDSSGNESIVISNNKEDTIDETNTNQYTWVKQISKIYQKPASVNLQENQIEQEYILSVNTNKGYFKNTEGNVEYTRIDETKWSEEYTKDCIYTDKNGDSANIPKGFKISMSPSMNIIENGLVAKDENNNEWIWINVSKSITKNSESDEEIEEALKEYAKDYTKGSDTQDNKWSDEYYEKCGYESEEEYKQDKSSMLNSIKKNGGFWISRYEAGIEGSDSDTSKIRTSYTEITTDSPKAVSQKDMMPYNFVTCSEAQGLANQMITDETKTSSLLFGIQWDLACKFLEENSELNINDIKSESNDWGNYYDSEFKITSENAKEYNSLENITGTKEADSKMLLTTGASVFTNKLNIYDFAGNVLEWTLESATTDTSNPSVARGGYYGDVSTNSAAYKYNTANYEKFDFTGFRVTLYDK